MTWRRKGQKTLICDGCGAIFDDRPRDTDRDVVERAKEEGWKEVQHAEGAHAGTHLCPSCINTIVDRLTAVTTN